MEDIAKIDKSVASVCKGYDKKKDAMLLMAPAIDLDKLLTPSLRAIAFLGDLILRSGKTNLIIDEKPKNVFNLLRFPNSFQTSLVQVTNDGWSAFNAAHTSMDQIRLKTGNVQDHIKTAVKFILTGSQRDIKSLVPKSLSAVQKLVEESLGLAEAVESRFVGIVELTGELLEALTNTEGVYDEKTEETKMTVEVGRTKKESRLKEKQDTERRLGNMEKELKEAQTVFIEATKILHIDDEVAGVSIAACEVFIEGVRHSTNFLNTITENVTEKTLKSTANNEDRVTDDMSLDTEVSRLRIYTKASTIHRYINQLVVITTRNYFDEDEVRPDIERIFQDDIGHIQHFIETSKDHVITERTNLKLRERVIKLCDDALDVCTRLKGLSKSRTNLENKTAVIFEANIKFKYLQNESMKLDVEASRALGRNPLDSRSPHLSKLMRGISCSVAIQEATENARYNTELAKERLQDAKRRQINTTNELGDLTTKWMDKSNMDLFTIREMLVQCIKAFTEIREQWGKVVLFFRAMASIINCCDRYSLTGFVDHATIDHEMKTTNDAPAVSALFRDAIFEQASKASQIAHVVHTIAETYVDISNKHLMDKITNLGILESENDENKIRLQRNELYKRYQDAQFAINHIVMSKREEFNVNVDKRIAQIQEIENNMPPIDPARLKEIQTNVTSGMAASSGWCIDDLA